MPKLKTKSGAKKRFKVTATGKVKTAQAGKRQLQLLLFAQQRVAFTLQRRNLAQVFLPLRQQRRHRR